MKIKNEDGVLVPTDVQTARIEAVKKLRADVPSKDTVASLRSEVEALKIFLGIKGGDVNV